MYPDHLRYTPEHEWVRREGPTTLRFGITAYAAEALGDVVFVQLPDAGAAVVAGEPCGEVESTKSVSDIYAPVDGTVSAVNVELEGAPELVNAEPYGQGWMADVECPSAADADAAWDALLSAEQYEARLA
ncbi:MAG: glycine cleavage system protein GcvH [Candidatus Nanopelagicales bacterium]|jgi:glycine cleavage system H protein|nr:glycine cleavage system protein GcvH [Candidatus Nanopelagicales bacterium]